jgi:ribonuclease I
MMMVLLGLLASLLLVVVSASPVESNSTTCYVLAYVWTPEFCSDNYPGCQRPLPWWESNFTLHGLWPQYSNAPGYPSFCTKEPFDPQAPASVGLSTMKNYWPNVKSTGNDPNYSSFWEHEWEKHGTCTGLSQKQYFQDAVDLIIRFGSPSVLAQAVSKGVIASGALRTAMGGPTRVALQCDEGHVLSGAFTCWSQSDGLPQKQIMCPPSVLKEDTCTASQLVVKHLSTSASASASASASVLNEKLPAGR